MRSARTAFFSALALTLVVGSAACGSDAAGPTERTAVSETFVLQTVNGVAVPVVPPLHWDRLDSETLVLGDGTFELRTVMSELNDAGVVVRTYNLFDRGTFTVSGSTLSFRFNGSEETRTGTRSGNTITSTFDHGVETSTWVYGRQ